MRYTVRDALQYCRPMLRQYGATHAIWTKSILFSVNHALLSIRNFQWYKRTRQHRHDMFADLTPNENWEVMLRTKHPVKSSVIDKFRWWYYKPIYGKWSEICDCPATEPNPCSYYTPCTMCTCDGCKPLDYKMKLPHNRLCPGERQVGSGEVLDWMWGANGNFLLVKPKEALTQLMVSYYKWFEPVTTFDSILPIPNHFIQAFAYYMVAHTKDLTYMQLGNQALEMLKKEDNIYPSTMNFDQQYPYSATPTNIIP